MKGDREQREREVPSPRTGSRERTRGPFDVMRCAGLDHISLRNRKAKRN